MSDFKEEMIQLIKFIAQIDFPLLKDEDIGEFYTNHEDGLIKAAIEGTLGYYIGYNLEGERQKREELVRRG